MERFLRSQAALFLFFTVSIPISETGAQTSSQRRATEIFRLGGLNPTEETAFSQEPRLLVDSERNVYVRLANEGQIRVFSSRGEFIRSIGRLGEGPGEFRTVAGHGFIADTLWVRNWPTPRISLFSKAGVHLSTLSTRVDFDQAFGMPEGVRALLIEGRVFYVRETLPFNSPPRLMVPLIVGDRDYSNQDTLGFESLPKGLVIPNVGHFRYRPFPIPCLYSLAPDGSGIVVVNWDPKEPGLAEVSRFKPGGSIVFRKELSFPALRIPEQLIDEAISIGVSMAEPAIEASRRAGASVPRDIRSAVRDGLSIPRDFPPVRNVVFGVDETIWLQRMVDLEGGPWVVIDGGGRSLFEVDLPPSLTVQQAFRDAIWGTMVDDLGIPYVIRLDLL